LPVYEFFCKPCNALDEVRRTVEHAKDIYLCPECGVKAQRKYTPPQITAQGESIKYMHPAFGRVMSDREAKEEAKRLGFVAVGTDEQKGVAPTSQSYDSPDYVVN